MITKRKVPTQPKTAEPGKTVLFSILAVVSLVLFLIASFILKQANFVDVEPLFRQYVLIASGFVMLISASLTVRKPVSGDGAKEKIVLMHRISIVGIQLAMVGVFVLLGLKGDTIAAAIVSGCGILLILAVVLPQTLSKMPRK